ncbi:bacteria responsive protein 2 [Anopheles sinensis]|uniref:Bacteria responsive protein 2 n=1 Tax=Anopheles sinensis TaxID=74873 RepID=A0A084VNH3_ANOSI|nr:bacteria responsive protein 2 [Anopheles sinensis]
MWWKNNVAALLFLVTCGQYAQTLQPKVLCYYDGANSLTKGLGKVTLDDIEPALPFCTHLVYGYAGIDEETYQAVSRLPFLDLDTGKGNYRAVTQLKAKYPALKVLLGIGGYKFNEPSIEYMNLLESNSARFAFINSVLSLVKTYGFDGIDLEWQFPQNKPQKTISLVGSWWHKFKKTMTGGEPEQKAVEHREEFRALLRELKRTFRADGFQLGITVLPHVNSSVYMDFPAIINDLDFVNIAAYDQQTPYRNPRQADYTAPLYELRDRVPGNNVDGLVDQLIASNAPASKLIVSIPTFARGWKLTSESDITGEPPIIANGPSNPGSQLQSAGFYSWAEVCAMLPNPSNVALKGTDAPLVVDSSKRFGSYAFRVPDSNGENGVWVSYEDPDMAGNKAKYVKTKKLGGIAIADLSYDDFRGSCENGEKFPILRAAKTRL